jgi:hypothetical protein
MIRFNLEKYYIFIILQIGKIWKNISIPMNTMSSPGGVV